MVSGAKRRSVWQFYAAPVVVMVLAYLLPMASAAMAIHLGDPKALAMRNQLVKAVSAKGPIAVVARQIHAGRYVRATLTVFLWNFLMGAVVMSTLVGGACFLLPPLVASGRGLMLGLLFDAASYRGAQGLVTIGTGILELPNYVLAGALGVRLGLAWLRLPRRERLREVWEQAKWSLPAVGLLLLLAAVWEVGGIFLLMRRP